jgi:hypothetical protein
MHVRTGETVEVIQAHLDDRGEKRAWKILIDVI